jgi:hypothetical protein
MCHHMDVASISPAITSLTKRKEGTSEGRDVKVKTIPVTFCATLKALESVLSDRRQRTVRPAGSHGVKACILPSSPRR